ncbi:MAG: ATP-dependent Clp protease ATP-binding subunit [Candidatus Zixiibacteriota bacterium]
MLDPEKLTEKSLKALRLATDEAKSRKNSMVEPIHLLYSMLELKDSIIPDIFRLVKADQYSLTERVQTELSRRPKLSSQPADVNISRELVDILEKAQNFMEKFKDEFISPEHVLLSMVKHDKTACGKMLRDSGLTEDKILAALKKIRGNKRITDQNPEEQYNTLEKFGIDYTDLAQKGKLDPVIGRQEEIRRVMKVLSRRRKNNPALIGEPGVGKTAIVEKLAQKIAADDVPEQLHGARLIQLDMGSLLAGTKFRGEFEKRLKSFIEEVTKSENKIILFIDEMHTIVGAGATGGAMDASNILKPALARGELHMIGATTIDEYRKHIEKDPALERRFATIMVDEPSVEETVSILRGLREKYELHHSVRITDEAIQSAAKLSARYISDRFLPDKAIDLIDEAAANLCIDLYSQPQEVDALEKKIAQLKIEIKGLSRESGNEEELKCLKNELRKAQDELMLLKSQWQKEKSSVEEIKTLREKIDAAKNDQEKAERAGELEKAARIKYGTLLELRKELEQKEQEIKEIQKESKLLKEEVDEDDVAQVLSQWTGIPVSRLTEGEKQKLLQLEDRLKERVIGQDHAVEAVANTVRIARAHLSDPKRPLGSFIFLGSTGVGKTELAKTLAETLFDTEETLIRIDMSEYMERHAVSRLIGAPPGYVGYEEGGQLTEAVRRHPFSVILFDEIEKAHPEVFNILLQVLDDGMLTDNKGRTVSFKNSILIMTSNLGSRLLMDSIKSGDTGKIKDETKRQLEEMLQQNLPPEFLNRIDEILIFNPLDREIVKEIVRLQFGHLRQRMLEQEIYTELSDNAADYLAKIGYDPIFGARPVKRTLQAEVTRKFAKLLLKGDIQKGDFTKVDFDGEKIIITKTGSIESDDEEDIDENVC